MLILPKSRFDVSASRPHTLAANHGVTDSGTALVYATGGSELAVKASTGVGGETFAGFALTDQGYPTRIAGVYTLNGTGAAALNVANLANYINASAYVVNQNGVAAGAKVVISATGQVDLGATNTLGDTYTIVYSYTPQMADLLRLYGEFPRMGASDMGAQVGLAKHGRFTITNFDTTVAWVIGATPVLAAGGFLTIGGAGTVLARYQVAIAASSGNPFLTLDSV